MSLHTRNDPDAPWVKCYCSFRKNGCFVIILEYADSGTLEDYLQSHDPPQHPRDILGIWKSYLHLLGAINTIHNLPVEVKDGVKTTFYG